MSRFLYDTAVFVYALGDEHPYRDSCREILAAAGRDELRGEASVDLVQELLHQRYRRLRDRAKAAEQAAQAAALCVLHEVRPEDVTRALTIFGATRRLGARDAVFSAVALNRDIGVILSPDRDFDEVAGLIRIDPRDRPAVETLVSA